MSWSTWILVFSGLVLGVHSYASDPPALENGDDDHICGGVRNIHHTGHNRGIDARHVLWGAAGAGLVPFKYHESCLETDIPLFEEAMQYIEAVSCVRFEEWSDQSTYLEFARACLADGTPIASCENCDCFSGSYVETTWGLYFSGPIRLVTGADLEAGDFSDRGHITHELLHALGHHHTQKRPDRDDYITLDMSKNYNNGQFVKCSTCKVMGTSYDCLSIMHYRDTAFAVNRSEPTMVALDPQTCDLKSTNRWMRWADIDLNNANYQCQEKIPLVSGGGILTSAETYPVRYAQNDSWIEYLVVEEGNTIELTFLDDFEIFQYRGECGFDWVAIVDGNGLDLLPRTCGTPMPPQITSTTNRVSVEFAVFFNRPDWLATTDFKGFKLQWREIVATPPPPPCCHNKTVGEVTYSLNHEDINTDGFGCLNNCTYTADDGPNEGDIFCFASGVLPVECMDAPTTILTTSTSTPQSTTPEPCTDCCETLNLGNSVHSQIWSQTGECLNNFPVWVSGLRYLFKLDAGSFGNLWMIGPNKGEPYGNILANGPYGCPDALTYWEYYNGSSWVQDEFYDATCFPHSGIQGFNADERYADATGYNGAKSGWVSAFL